MNIAIVGATGNVGRKMLEVLEQKKISIDQLFLVASPRSAGQKVNFNGKEHEIFNLETYDFSKAEITFFAAGGKISEKYAEKAAKHTTIIDNSSFFRMDQDVPLIVPQVNPDAIDIITDDCNGKATDDHDSDWERFEELCFEFGVDPEDPDAHFKLYDPEDDEDDLYDYNY